MSRAAATRVLLLLGALIGIGPQVTGEPAFREYVAGAYHGLCWNGNLCTRDTGATLALVPNFTTVGGTEHDHLSYRNEKCSGTVRLCAASASTHKFEIRFPRVGAASRDDESPMAELVWRRQLFASDTVGKENSTVSPNSRSPRSRSEVDRKGSDALVVAAAGRPGKIVLLSAGQLLNDTGEYRISGEKRVRKAAGFEIAYDYYFRVSENIRRCDNCNIKYKSAGTSFCKCFLLVYLIDHDWCISVV